MLEKWVQQLGKELEMSELIQSVAAHQYEVPFYPNHRIRIEQLTHSFLLKADIGKCSWQDSSDFLMQTMEANLFGRGTRRAVIGWNELGKLLTLSLELDYNSSYKEFKDALEDFVSVLEFWQQQLQHLKKNK